MAIPKPRVFWPLTIDGTNDGLVVNTGADHTAAIAHATYYDPETLAAALQAAIIAATADATFTCAYGTTGLLTIARTGSFQVKGGAAGSTAYDLLGFFAVTYTGASITSPHQHKNGWYSPTPFLSDSRSHREEPNSVVTVTESGKSKVIREPALTTRTVDFHFLPKAYTRIEDEDAVLLYTSIERWWTSGASRFRLWPDVNDLTKYSDYLLDSSVVRGSGFAPERQFPTREFYRVGPWKLRAYV